MSAVVISEPTPPRATGTPTSVGVGRLALVELRRYLARAGVRWLVVGMIAVVAMTAFGAYRSSRPATPAQRTQAQQAYDQASADWRANGAAQIAGCQEAQAQARTTDPTADFGCQAMTAPALDSFVPVRQTFADSAAGWLGQVSIFVLLLALLIGATFVAAEFSTGSISTWLTFEPRRVRVFASKVVVPALATGVVVLAVAVLAIGAFWAAVAVNGSAGAVTAQLWVDLGNQAARLACAGAFAAAGGALAFLLRHTGATLGVVVGWLVAVDGILASLFVGLRRWTTQISLTAWLQAGVQEQVGATSCSSGPSGVTTCNGTPVVVSMTQGGLLLLAVLVAVTALALLVFRRRDVG